MSTINIPKGDYYIWRNGERAFMIKDTRIEITDGVLFLYGKSDCGQTSARALYNNLQGLVVGGAWTAVTKITRKAKA